MSSNQEYLQGLLMRALESRFGIILTIRGSEADQRQSALNALLSARRALQADEPNMLNLRIKPHPTNPNQIIIQKLLEP